MSALFLCAAECGASYSPPVLSARELIEDAMARVATEQRVLRARARQPPLPAVFGSPLTMLEPPWRVAAANAARAAQVSGRPATSDVSLTDAGLVRLLVGWIVCCGAGMRRTERALLMLYQRFFTALPLLVVCKNDKAKGNINEKASQNKLQTPHVKIRSLS